VFDGFMNAKMLSDEIISLVCMKKHFVDFYGQQTPAYEFDICVNDVKVGSIRLRIGYSEGIYYSGHIGFAIDEVHRGNGYAARACRLLIPIARHHEMAKLLISNNAGIIASYRICERLEAQLMCKAELPNWHDAYNEGHRCKNIFEWDVRKF